VSFAVLDGVLVTVPKSSRARMGTVVTIEVVGHDRSARARRTRELAIARAFAWFDRVESVCSRFDAGSELRCLCATSGVDVVVSPMLFEAVRFAVAVAEETHGAFDPTVGAHMEARGFHRDYRDGVLVRSGVSDEELVSYRDVVLNESARSVRLERALLLDLGAVAKGLAIDMAVQELRPLANYVVDAGGDLYCGGHNAAEQPWMVGIRHPRESNALLTRVAITDAALCTSGDYERRVTDGAVTDGAEGEHHLLDPTTGASPRDVISASVIAPTAMVADALGTAAFVLGCAEGIALLEHHGLRACLVDAQLVRHTTPDWIDV
jgi:thiamine biosynthesis lipoprotein